MNPWNVQAKYMADFDKMKCLYVFIERGKSSGLENFRRIGDINNTGALRKYGYGFFDVKVYNEV